MHVPILYNYCIICSAFLSLVLVPGKRKNGQKCCWCFRNISLLYCRGLPLQKSCNLVMISQRHGLLRAGSSGCFGDSGDKCHRLVTPIDCETVEGNRKAIERYSKKYLSREKEHAAWTPDWRRLPREMKPRKKMKKAGAKPRKANSSDPKSNLDVLKKIEELEKKDDEEEKSEDEKDKTKDKEGEDDDEAEEPEEYDEEEHEEENDYISSYFEDGDDFGADSDDNMDEATY
nr:DNA-directed RNA polymerase III subunit RPC7 isoform X1 [Anser cygnoides]